MRRYVRPPRQGGGAEPRKGVEGMRKVPKLTHLQILVLAIATEGEQWGREFREKLGDRGCRMSGPAFYQLMSRMEVCGLVKGKYQTKVVKGQTIKQRRYRATAEGQ